MAQDAGALKARNILVFGGTGLIGSVILDALISAKAHFNRIAVFTSVSTTERKSAAIESIKNRGAEIVVGDVTNEQDVLEAYKGEKLEAQTLNRVYSIYFITAYPLC